MAGKSKVQEAQRLDLLEAILRAGATDLASIDAEIAAKEEALAAAKREIETELAMLKQLRRVLDVKLNGKPARKVRQPKAAKAKGTGGGGQGTGSDDDDTVSVGGLASQIIHLLDAGTGVAPIDLLAERLGRNVHGIKLAISKCRQLQLLDGGRVAMAGYVDED